MYSQSSEMRGRISSTPKNFHILQSPITRGGALVSGGLDKSPLRPMEEEEEEIFHILRERDMQRDREHHSLP